MTATGASRWTRRRAALVAGALLPVMSLVGGCAAGAENPPAHDHHTAASAGAAGSTGSGNDSDVDRSGPDDPGSVRVGLTEWSIAVAVPAVDPGKVTLLVTNAGGTEHDLYVGGKLGRWHTPDLDPGERTELTVRAKPGEQLRLWCSLPGHEVQGMHTVLPVRPS